MSVKSAVANMMGCMGIFDLYAAVRNKVKPSWLSIIIYHHVNVESLPWQLIDVTPVTDFEKEIAYIGKHAEILPLDYVVNQLTEMKPIPERTVCITFDDGFKDNYTHAYPLLKKYKVPATIFLSTSHINGNSISLYDEVRYAIWITTKQKVTIPGLGELDISDHNKRLSAIKKIRKVTTVKPDKEAGIFLKYALEALDTEISPDFGEKLFLSWDEITEMSNGGISFGAHTVTHPNLTAIPVDNAEWEISTSKKEIEEKLGRQCNLFAYPFGYYNSDIVQLLKKHGFKGAVTTDKKMNDRRNVNSFLLGRNSAQNNFYSFKAVFCGMYPDLINLINKSK